MTMKRTYIQPCAVAFATATAGQLLAGSTGEGGPDITDKGGSGSDPNTAKRHTFDDFDDSDEVERMNETAQSLSLPRFSVWD